MYQQAFNATAVVRHMRRLQLGSSMGSSMDATHSSNANQNRVNANQTATASPNQTLNSTQNVTASLSPNHKAAQNQNTVLINDMATGTASVPRKDCKFCGDEFSYSLKYYINQINQTIFGLYRCGSTPHFLFFGISHLLHRLRGGALQATPSFGHVC